MNRLALAACLPFLLLGCDLITPIDINSTSEAKLIPFESQKQLEDYMRDQVSERNQGFGMSPDVDRNDQFVDLEADGATGADGGSGGDGLSGEAPPTPSADSAGAAGGEESGDADFSQTTTQESGVDEADVVKTDGTYIYVVSHGNLRIIRAVPSDNMELVAEVPLKGYGRDMYLSGDQVVVMSSVWGGYYLPEIEAEVVGTSSDGEDRGDEPGSDEEPEEPKDDPDVDPGDEPLIGDFEPYYERPACVVTVIDVADPASPEVMSTTSFDGDIASSRMIDGELHLVLANYQHYYYDVIPMWGRAEFDSTAVEPQMILPHYSHIDADGEVTEGMALTWDRLYRPESPDGFGVVSVISLKPEEALNFKAVGVVAEPGNVYSSTKSLYLTDTDYDFQGTMRESTNVYKLKYTEEGPVPVAAGGVPGRVLNQYSMGEHNDHLRVATTVRPGFTIFGDRPEPENHIYVLAEQDGRLVRVGSIVGLASGETIQSARFVGDRGYVVTFREIDPLFTLDMSNPADPQVIGELKVPGFSTFMVPMDQDHLLTVGRYVPEDGVFFGFGVQLSIFDVTDFANPRLEHLEVIGEDSDAWSEALHNPKAFTYFAEEGLVALPISIYERFDFFGFEDDVAVDQEPGEDGGDTVDTGEGGQSDGSEGETEPGDTEPGDGEPGEPDPGDDEPDVTEPAPDFLVPRGFDGILVYEVSTETGFEALGRVNMRFENNGSYWWPGFMRGIFMDSKIYGVSDNGIRAAALDDVNGDQDEIVFGGPNLDIVDETLAEPR
ncbi:MAG: beta-propeller domain-containing protein [Planctomycetota bacterium]|jgi:hypothetical protein